MTRIIRLAVGPAVPLPFHPTLSPATALGRVLHSALEVAGTLGVESTVVSSAGLLSGAMSSHMG